MENDEKKGFSRRGFLRGIATTTAALGLPAQELLARPGGQDPQAGCKPTEFDFTRQSGALQPDQIVDSACQFCNSLCRLKVHLKAGRDHRRPRRAGRSGAGRRPVRQGADDDAAGLQPLPPHPAAEARWRRQGLARLEVRADHLGRGARHHRPEVPRPARRRRGAGDRQQDLAAGCRAAPARSSAASSSLLGSPNDTDVGPVCNDAGGERPGLDLRPGQLHQRLRHRRRDRQGRPRSCAFLPVPRHQPGRDAPGHLRLSAARPRARPAPSSSSSIRAGRRPARRPTSGSLPSRTPTSPWCWPCCTTSSPRNCTTRPSCSAG